MDELLIREIRVEDAENILNYINKVAGETDNLTFGEDGLSFTIEEEESYIRKEIDDQHTIHYCAWRGNELIGEANITGQKYRLSHVGVLGITIKKSEWNKGVGSLLIDKLIDFAKNNEIEIVTLDVRVDNEAAIHLYEKHGFKRIGVKPGFMKVGSEYFDIIQMYLKL